MGLDNRGNDRVSGGRTKLNSGHSCRVKVPKFPFRCYLRGFPDIKLDNLIGALSKLFNALLLSPYKG